jgi:hypothetical protein
MINDLEMEIAFVWGEEGSLYVILYDEAGEQIEYEFDSEEVNNLYNFLKAKVEKSAKSSKVLTIFADNTNRTKVE